MAYSVSPSVSISEKDLTNVTPAVTSSIGGIAIDAVWGPVLQPTTIDSENTLVQTFGKPQTANAKNWFTAANFLSYSNNCLVVRTDTSTQRNAVSQVTGSITSIPVTTGGTGYVSTGANAAYVNIPAPTTIGGIQAVAVPVIVAGVVISVTITNPGTGYDAVPTVTVVGPNSTGSSCVIGTVITTTGGIKVNNDDHYNSTFANGEGTVGNWAAKYPGALGNSLIVSMADAGSWNTWGYKSQFDAAPGTSAQVAAVGGSGDEMHIAVIDADGKWTGTAGTVLEKFAFVSKATDVKGQDGNTLFYRNVISTNSKYIRWMDDHSYLSAGNAFGGTSTTGVYGDLLVGTQQTGTITTTTSAASVTGVGTAFATTDVGKKLYSTGGVLIGTISAYTSATAVTLGANATLALTGANFVATYATGTITTTTSSSTVTGVGTQFTLADIGKKLYNAAGTLIGTIISFASATSVGLGNYATGATANAAVAVTAGPFSVSSSITGQLVGGVDSLTSTNGEKMAAFITLDNKEQYDMSLLMAGAADTVLANYLISNIAEVRKDCIVCISVQNVSSGAPLIGNTSDIGDAMVAYRNALPSSSYATLDSGYKYQYDRYNDTFRWIPLNGDIAGVCARTDYTNDSWWSPGGFNRGQIKNVVKLAFNPRQADRDNLYKNGVNPVVSFPGQGVVLYGDKTLLAKPSAFDRINVRRLFITLEKVIGLAAKYQLFEFNDFFTRTQFVGTVTPFLRDVQGRRGITDFKVVCDESNNTPQVVDSNQFVGDIYVKPTRAINFMQLNFVATRTGVSFSDVAGA